MRDLVERLRRAADQSANGGGNWFQLVHRCREAADRIAELEAENDACLTRQAELLEAIEIECGTGWTCECGHNMYNSYGPTCHDCGRDAPLLNRIAFKLHAGHSDRPRLAEAEALLREATPLVGAVRCLEAEADDALLWLVKCGDFLDGRVK